MTERLHGYNPPDRTLNAQRQMAVDIADAAAEIAILREALMSIRELVKGPMPWALPDAHRVRAEVESICRIALSGDS